MARGLARSVRSPSSSDRVAILVDSRLPPGGPFTGLLLAQPCPEPWVDRDMHHTFEVGVLIAGRQHRSFGEWRTTLRPGDVYLTPAWESHGWQTLLPGTRLLVLMFQPGFLGEAALGGASWLTLFARPPAERPRVRDDRARRQVLAIARDVIAEIREKRPGWLDAVRLGLLRLLLVVSRAEDLSLLSRSRYGKRTADLARVRPALDLARSLGPHRPTLRLAADACSLSPSQFAYIFRRTMGQSFGQFALRARLTHAADLLINTDLSLVAIAQRLGFVDPSHLHRRFTQVYRTTPARYREQRRHFREQEET